MKNIFRKSKPQPSPRVSDGTLIYAIGDIHGRLDRLEAIYEAIDGDPLRHDFDQVFEIYLGDYVDRGPHSMGVIDSLLQRLRERTVIALKGNHESLFQDALIDQGAASAWRQFGGIETMTSYGVRVRLPITDTVFEQFHREWIAAVPRSHRTFMESLPFSVSDGGYFFCHAGIRPGIALNRQIEADLLWIRDEFLESKRWHGARIVHGHTPVETPEIKPNRINLDTGAYMTGRLTCLRLHGNAADII